MAIIWALVLPILIGFVALGIETSTWYMRQTDLESATDAAAIATGYALREGSDLAAVAHLEMGRNGFGPGEQISIAVNHPPNAGLYAGDSNAIEIITALPHSSFWNYPFQGASLTLRARAVAVRGSLVE